MTMTPEQIAEARRTMSGVLRGCSHTALYEHERFAVEVLLAATAPDPGPPRPDDMVELAKLVAKELRSRGIWACVPGQSAIRVPGVVDVRHRHYYIHDAQFADLTPREIADVIQAEEAAKAKEWAGDE